MRYISSDSADVIRMGIFDSERLARQKMSTNKSVDQLDDLFSVGSTHYMILKNSQTLSLSELLKAY